LRYYFVSFQETVMANRDTLTLLDDLEKFGLRDPLFRERLHHLGDTVDGFRAWAMKVGSFQESGCNQLLHDRLDYIRTECGRGALARGKTMEGLIDEAKQNVPCREYATCKKHISDAGCPK
jgi:hypothetical protein